MPFTLSHPAAILPLIRHPFVVPALIAGSMAPDVPVFARIQATEAVWWEPLFNQTHTHSAAGAVGVDLGYALGLMGLYLLLRRPVLALVPPLAARAGIREAGEPRPHGRGPAGALRLALWTGLSALIGIVTHIVWDSFTHYQMFFHKNVAFMSTEVIGGLDVLRLLQHLSTVAGLLIIGVWLLRRWRATPPTPLTGSAVLTAPARSVVLAVLAVAAAGGAAWGLTEPYATASLEHAAREIASGGGLVLTVTLMLYAIGRHVFLSLHRNVSDSPGA